MTLRPSHRRLAVRVGSGILVALALATGAFFWWASTPLGPSPEAIEALESTDVVAVDIGADWIAFAPAGESSHAGVILYPGGRVDYRSYAPVAREVAALGYVVVVPRMPLSLAVLDPDAATPVIEAHPDVLVWGIGGHSLGGAMAASYAEDNPDRVSALFLLAAYPASGTDLSDNEITAVSLFGTRDGVLSEGGMERSIELLPESTAFEQIDGGNHAQFGSYGKQPGDNDALISAQEQQAWTAEQIALLMRPLRIKTLGP